MGLATATPNVAEVGEVPMGTGPVPLEHAGKMTPTRIRPAPKDVKRKLILPLAYHGTKYLTASGQGTG